MPKIRASIVGASGYTGGELLRLLLSHPEVEVGQVTSERLAGKFIHVAHPNLRRRSNLKFVPSAELESCDVLFLCLPHGEAMRRLDHFESIAPRIIDLSSDFRLKDGAAYAKWYGEAHACPEKLGTFVYGIPELHRAEMSSATRVSSAGCNATASILGLYPLFKHGLASLDRTVIEVKVGSSEGGNTSSDASHHPERIHCVRSFMPTRHRHIGEIEQELGFAGTCKFHFSATAIDLVRGILATSHVFLNKTVTEKEVWQVYREQYNQEPFIRIVKDSQGSYRYPEPKLLWGTNYCDVGFELDPETGRVVVISAIDNLMKGAAGQAVQAFNLMHQLPETLGLEFSGLHPV